MNDITKTNGQLLVEMIAKFEERQATLMKESIYARILEAMLERLGFYYLPWLDEDEGFKVNEFTLRVNHYGVMVTADGFEQQTYISGMNSVEAVRAWTDEAVDHVRDALGFAFQTLLKQMEDRRNNPPIKVVRHIDIQELAKQLNELWQKGYVIVSHTTINFDDGAMWNTVIMRREEYA